MILCLAISVEHQLVTNRQTDRHMMTAYTTLAWCHAVKMVTISNYRNKNTLTVILAATFQNRFIKIGRLLSTYLPWKSSEITRWHGWTERFTRILFGRNSVFIFGRTTLSKVDRMRILEFGWRNGSLPWQWVSVRAAVSIAATVMSWTQCSRMTQRLPHPQFSPNNDRHNSLSHASCRAAVCSWAVDHNVTLPLSARLYSARYRASGLDWLTELWFYIQLHTK